MSMTSASDRGEAHRWGYASNWLCDNVSVGMEMTVLTPSGKFTAKSLDVDMLFFAGGSGITPILSLVKSALVSGSGEVVLFYANLDADSIMYERQLQQIRSEFPERFTLVDWLESENGIPTSEAVEKMIRDHKGSVIFTCGPSPSWIWWKGLPPRVEWTIRMYIGRCSSRWRVTRSTPPHCVDSVTMRVWRRPRFISTESASPRSGHVTRRCSMCCSRGHNAPYSCREGACSACVCKLIEGDVDMVQNNILVDDDIEDGERLACQALPLTDAVTVSFDDL